jgi:hypothetical protein
MATANPSASLSPRFPAHHVFEPPLVHRGPQPGEWVVCAPPDAPEAEPEVVFDGSEAQQRALTYAYERFGNVRFFPY